MNKATELLEAINSLEGSAQCTSNQVNAAALKLGGKDVAKLISDALGKSGSITRSDIRAACQKAGLSNHANGIIGEIFRTNEAAEVKPGNYYDRSKEMDLVVVNVVRDDDQNKWSAKVKYSDGSSADVALGTENVLPETWDPA